MKTKHTAKIQSIFMIDLPTFHLQIHFSGTTMMAHRHFAVNAYPEWAVYPTVHKNDQPTKMTNDKHGLAHNDELRQCFHDAEYTMKMISN